MRRLFRLDLLALLAWQLGNYAIPLALLPYFSRTLGVDGLGIYGIALGVVNIGLMITDWGFIYTAQRALVECEGDHDREQAIIWDTVTAKLALALGSALAIVFAIFWLGWDSPYSIPLLIGISALAGNVFSMEWVLRAKSMFPRFAAASVVGRLLSVPFALLLVRDTQDVALAIGAIAFGQIAAAAFSIVMALPVKLGAPRLHLAGAIQRITDGTSVFLTAAATNLYALAVPPVVGMAANTLEAGYYAGADRMRGAARMFLYPVTVFIYPRINALRIQDPARLQSYLPKVFTLFLAASTAVCGSLALTAPIIVPFILGSAFGQSIVVFQLLAANAFVSSLVSFAGTNVLISFGFDRHLLISQISGIAVGAAVILPLIANYGAAGAALSVLLAECVALLAVMAVILRKMPWFAVGLLPKMR